MKATTTTIYVKPQFTIACAVEIERNKGAMILGLDESVGKITVQFQSPLDTNYAQVQFAQRIKEIRSRYQ